jgi:hypothetical protein
MRMNKSIVISLVAVTMLLMGHSMEVRAASNTPTSIEMVLLPRYCWARFNPQLKGRKGFDILGCGVGTNHYCEALVILQRAEKMPHGNAKVGQFERVLKQMQYTLGFMGNPDNKNCWLKAEAEKMEMAVMSKINNEKRYNAIKIR